MERDDLTSQQVDGNEIVRVLVTRSASDPMIRELLNAAIWQVHAERLAGRLQDLEVEVSEEGSEG